MPYESAAQRRYMHAKHPEIASRWDAEIRAKKKKGKITKARRDWAVGLGTAAVGGAVANQIPPIRRKDIQAVERKLKKKGQVKKMQAPTSDDPFFNQAAAQKTFDLIMKMDDDTAEVFCHIIASDLLEREVEENRVTLQKHLDAVLSKRLVDVKQAMLRAVSKGMDEPVAHAQALAMIDSAINKVSSVNDDDIPNWTFERKIRRDPSSGRFQAKISNRAIGKHPIPDKTAESMGIEGTKESRYKKLSSEDKARYQHQYQQVANFIDAVNAATDGPGNNRIMLHYRDDKTGETWSDEHTGGKPPHSNMLTAGHRVIGAEALPTTLTAGGAAFSLAGAMGRTMDTGTVERWNTAAANSQKWTDDWVKEGDGQNQNARLYQRTKTLGDVAGALGPPGSKVQLAGKMAEIVGQYGPQAENVLGPAARKTAYRYRGTEKTPDKRLVEMYGQAVEQNKKMGPLDPWAEQAEAKLRAARGAKKQPFGSETGIRGGRGGHAPKPPATPSLTQMVAEREARAGRAPEWQERELGRHAVTQYLTDQLPSKQYYKLQLASGNTPPSEGVIIDAQGQIVTQAVGYGDDHYLPFNLKNLKGLKGGEYIRNRSVGGLTSEDVYTGLISGARRVTVVSRSGTFTMEFKPDFRGGRRHNDKARRMTRRYEQVLDAVQSEQVERANVPVRWRKMIEDEVKGEYPPTASPRLIRAEIDARIKEFKANPQIDGRDLDRAEAEISRMEEQEKRGLVSRQDVGDYRKQVMGELRDLKEIHFRLNGVGYQAALDSLQEQFPYYINVQSRPKAEDLEGNVLEHEMDRGYVEPGRNRPTAAQAGWYGTAGKEKSRKFSAAHADYQRGVAGAPEPGHRPGSPPTADASTGAGSSGGGGMVARSDRERARDRAAEALSEGRAKAEVKAKAVALQQQIKNTNTLPPDSQAPPEWWDMSESDMSEYLDKEENLKKFDSFANSLSDKWGATSAARQWNEYRNAKNRGTGQPYAPGHANTWQSAPYKFPDDERDAYRPSPLAGRAMTPWTRWGEGSPPATRRSPPGSSVTTPVLPHTWRTSTGCGT
jgi:hypothetical protein